MSLDDSSENEYKSKVVSVRMEGETIERVDSLVDEGKYDDRTDAIVSALETQSTKTDYSKLLNAARSVKGEIDGLDPNDTHKLYEEFGRHLGNLEVLVEYELE